ncbi:MAG: phage antirepressor [Smithella sp.]|nr:phage antirepressor [Smithella sp.]
MNSLQVFQNSDFGQVRVVTQNGEPWFVAMDACEILELTNTSIAIGRLDDDEVTKLNLGGLAGEVNAVNESGLYSLILGSRKPEARRFKKWVTSEVLPTIRKTGMYGIPQTLPEALRLAADLAEENQRLLPKAKAHDHFLAATNAQTMNVAAKSLGIGRNKLFEFLRARKLLMRNNIPYQEYLGRGYFEVIEKTIDMGTGVINKPQTLVTAKGIDYIGRLLKDGEQVG